MSAQTAVSPEALRAELAKTNQIFSDQVIGKRNLDAIDDCYTREARILPPGAPTITGRAGIREFWMKMLESTGAKSLSLRSLEVKPAGEGAVEIGAATLVMEPEGQPAATAEMKYVVYWRQEDGRWKWDVDIWN